MNPLKLIVENDFYDYDVILEQENASKPKFLKIRGPYVVSEQKNANKRFYGRPMMEKSVDKFTTGKIKCGLSLGELNHPDSVEVNSERACHRITSLTPDGNTWIGESIVLCSSSDGVIKGTPCGDILASIIQHGGKPGMSTRGVGNIIGDGIVESYELITIDVVSNPSGPNCFVEGILESRNFMITEHGEIVEIAYDLLDKKLKKMPSKYNTKVNEEYLAKILKEFIQAI